MAMKSVGSALIFTCLLTGCGSSNPELPSWQKLAERYQPQIVVTPSESPSTYSDTVVCQEKVDQNECLQQMANMRFELSKEVDALPGSPEKNAISPLLEEFKEYWTEYGDGCFGGPRDIAPIICHSLGSQMDASLVGIWTILEDNKG